MFLRDLLQSLPFVVVRRMNAREGFFTAGRMFALLGDSTLLLRLPVPATNALVEADLGRTLVEPPVPAQLAWVTVPLGSRDVAELRELVLAAHQAVRTVSRRDRSVPRRRRNRALPKR